jgi:hypothetical protein
MPKLFYKKIKLAIALGVPLLRRVGALRASLRSVLRTLRPSMHLTQNFVARGKKAAKSPYTSFGGIMK